MLKFLAMMLMSSAAMAQTVNLGHVPNVTGHACGALTGVITVVGLTGTLVTPD